MNTVVVLFVCDCCFILRLFEFLLLEKARIDRLAIIHCVCVVFSIFCCCCCWCSCRFCSILLLCWFLVTKIWRRFILTKITGIHTLTHIHTESVHSLWNKIKWIDKFTYLTLFPKSFLCLSFFLSSTITTKTLRKCAAKFLGSMRARIMISIW